MTSLERARRFVEAKGRVIALTVVPLASLVSIAVPAKASTVFSLSTGSCIVSTTSAEEVSGSCGAASVGSVTEGIGNGITITGSGTVTASGSGSSNLTLTQSGTMSGFFDGSIPVDWNFQTASSDDNSIDWTLTYYFNNSGSGTPYSLSESGSTTPGAVVSGTDSLSFDSAAYNYEVVLSLNEYLDSYTDTLSVTVPIGINDQSSTPEPASVFLGGTGLLAVLFSRFRRKRA